MTAHATTQRKFTGRVPVPVIGPPGFVGRERELAELARAVAGGPSVVLIEGEAGLGKTRLVQEFLASREDGRGQVLVAGCPAFGQPLTLGPVVDALRQAAPAVARLGLSPLAGALRPLFPEWADGLPAVPEPLEDAAAARHRLFSALAELLDRLGVAVLVLDDVQCADEATVEFLLFVACRRPRRVSLVLTCRPEDVPAYSLLPRLSRLASGAGGRRLGLAPLDVSETAAVMSSMLGGEPVSEEFAAFVQERTEGVPLAVEESVRLMGERADLTRRSGHWVRRDVAEIDVPATVRESVLERAGRLSADGRAVLRAAAVLAEPTAEATVAMVAGLPRERVREGVCEGLSCGLLAEGEDYPHGQALVSFRHVLSARAVYESVPGPRRRELHLRAGHALEHQVPLPLARLARHFREARDAAWWCRYGEQAADLALASGDESTAMAVLQDLIMNGGLPTRDAARLAGKMPMVLLAGLPGDLVGVLRSVIDGSGLTRAERAEVRFQLGRLLFNAGENEAGAAELERAIPDLGHRPLEAAKAMTWLGWPIHSLWSARVHRQWLDRAAVQMADPAIPARDRLELVVDRATALLALGEEAGWAAANEFPYESATPQETLPVARGCSNIGNSAMLWGYYEVARRRLTACAELTGQRDYTAFRDQTRAILGRLDWLTGSWDAIPGCLDTLEDTGDEVTWIHTTMVAGLFHCATGNHRVGGNKLGQVLQAVLDGGMVDDLGEPAAALARLYLAESRHDEALEVTREPVRVIMAKEIWLWGTDIMPARVRALCAAGQTGDADDLTAAFASGLCGCPAPAPEAALATCQAILVEAQGDHVGASALFANAAAAWQALPRPYDALLAREEQARCLLAAGQPDNALRMLSGLRDELVALGAVGDADRVVFTLREHGVAAKRAQRGGRRTYGDRLSPREEEVVQLFVEGQTVRQIAASLVVSPKTVSYHLDSARRKLKVPSRRALVATAVTAGLAVGQAPAATG